MIKYITERLKEPSTMRGFIWIAVACGVQIQPDHIPDIVGVGTLIAGLLGILLPDK